MECETRGKWASCAYRLRAFEVFDRSRCAAAEVLPVEFQQDDSA